MLEIKIKKESSGFILPKKAHEADAAYDLYVPNDVVLKTGRNVIDLGFSLEIPEGFAATIQPRSGFSAKGMDVICEIGETKQKCRCDADVIRGLIDSCYRGHVCVIVDYHARYNYTEADVLVIIEKGTRIAQMQIIEVPQAKLVEVEETSETERGNGGFGSTGK